MSHLQVGGVAHEAWHVEDAGLAQVVGAVDVVDADVPAADGGVDVHAEGVAGGEGVCVPARAQRGGDEGGGGEAPAQRRSVEKESAPGGGGDHVEDEEVDGMLVTEETEEERRTLQ